MLTKILSLVLLIGIVSAVEVDFDCPDDIYVDEEFECDVGVIDGDYKYDLKVEVDEERDSVLRIWDEGDWKSGYYYLKSFVRDDEVVKLKILERGRYDVVLKLRKDDFRKEFDVGRLKVLERVEEEAEDKEIEDEKVVDEVVEDEIVVLNKVEVISLNGKVSSENEEWDYVSKDGMVVDWLPYAFGLFMIFLVGILIWFRIE